MTCRNPCIAVSASCTAISRLSRTINPAETIRRCGELHAQFLFGRFEELCEDGVTVFLDKFQGRLRDLGARIADDFLVPMGTK